jgi:hypothetical protein
LPSEPPADAPSPQGDPHPPPEAAPHPGPAPARRRPGGCLIAALVAGGLVLFTVLVVVSLTLSGLIGTESPSERARILAEVEQEYGIATSSQDTDHPPQRDVRLGRCELDADGRVMVAGTVTNFTPDPADYQLSLVFLDGSGSSVGAELAATTVDVDAVAPARTVNWSSNSGVSAAGDFTCRIVRVERTP